MNESPHCRKRSSEIAPGKAAISLQDFELASGFTSDPGVGRPRRRRAAAARPRAVVGQGAADRLRRCYYRVRGESPSAREAGQGSEYRAIPAHSGPLSGVPARGVAGEVGAGRPRTQPGVSPVTDRAGEFRAITRHPLTRARRAPSARPPSIWSVWNRAAAARCGGPNPKKTWPCDGCWTRARRPIPWAERVAAHEQEGRKDGELSV